MQRRFGKWHKCVFIVANKSFEKKIKKTVMIHFEDEQTKK